MYDNKIYASQKALIALKELESRAINCNSIDRRDDQVKIACLNVQNLIHHIEDVKNHHRLNQHNLILLSETWFARLQTASPSNPYRLTGYDANYINVGSGKELAPFSEP